MAEKKQNCFSYDFPCHLQKVNTDIKKTKHTANKTTKQLDNKTHRETNTQTTQHQDNQTFRHLDTKTTKHTHDSTPKQTKIQLTHQSTQHSNNQTNTRPNTQTNEHSVDSKLQQPKRQAVEHSDQSTCRCSAGKFSFTKISDLDMHMQDWKVQLCTRRQGVTKELFLGMDSTDMQQWTDRITLAAKSDTILSAFL